MIFGARARGSRERFIRCAHQSVCVSHEPVEEPAEPWGLPEPDVEYKLAARLLAQDPPMDRDVLEALVGAPKRYRDLKPLLGGRNDHVLTKALARLRDDGLIRQGIDLDPTREHERVYALTALGTLVVFRLHEMIPHHESIRAYERGRAGSA